MKPSNLFYGILFLFLGYIVQIPSFGFSINGWIVLPIPNPLHVFADFTIIFVVIGIACILTAFQDEKEKTEKESQRR